MPKEFNFVDVFCGAGGLSCGLEMSGMSCILGTDQEKSAILTFKKNHPNAETFVDDISKLSKDKIKKLIGSKKIHLVCGGPPCQGMSTVGLGIPDDPRNFLFLEFIRLVKELKPDYVILENVTGMVGKKNKKILDAIMHKFFELGYIMSTKVLSAEHYGVAQRRRRTIVIGNRKGYEFKFPNPRFGKKKNLPPYVTVEDVFKEISKNTPNHDTKTSKIKDKKELDRIKMIPEGKGIRYHEDEKKYWEKKLWLDIDWSKVTENHRLREIKFHRLDRKNVSPTIMTGRYTYYHPTKDRYLTARAAASIMSFPNDFIFEGTVSQQWRQIGNAVAPLLGKALGKAIFDTNKKKKKAKTTQPRIVKNKAFDYEDDMLDENHAITDF